MTDTNPAQVTACVLFFISIFYFIQRKKFLIASICTIAFASYVAINLNVGVIRSPEGGEEQDYVARYVDWSLTTPLLLFTLLRLCRRVTPSVYVLVLTLDVLMVYMGYLAAISSSAAKRNAFFAVSSFFYVAVFVLVFRYCGKTHLGLCLFLLFAWMVYPVLWMLHRVPSETPYLDTYQYDACISALDVFSKIGYGLILPI